MNTYYANELYPLQDNVLQVIDTINTPFYLTGGTALSRCYFQHRYSDDLDLFVNKDLEFTKYAEDIIAALSSFDDLSITTRTQDYYSFLVNKILKVDLVNDVASHIGAFAKRPLYSQIDNVNNILSNKISALLGRDEPKDVVDIWIIAMNKAINWQQIFMDVSSKAVGIFPPLVAQRLETFPVEMASTLKWIEGQTPSQDTLKKDIATIVGDILQIDKDFKKLKK